MLEASLQETALPVHHNLVPLSSWHSTVFAIVKITGKRPTCESGSEEAENLLRRIGTSEVVARLCDAYEPLTVTSESRKCFDNNTTVQFAPTPGLKEFREKVRRVFEPGLNAILDESKGSFRVESKLDDIWKSQGSSFFGSVGRSLSRSDTDFLRWQCPLSSVSLTFAVIHLLVSDDALTNPRKVGQSDLPVYPTQGY